MEQTENFQPQAVVAISQKLPPFSELFKQALDFYKQRVRLVWMVCILPVVALVAAELLREVSKSGSGVLAFVGAIINIFASLALLNIATDTEEGIPNTVGYYYKQGARVVLPFIWAGILGSLAVMGGALLLVIPGIIISVLISFWAYILVKEGRRGFLAACMSWYYVRGFWRAVLWKGIVLGFTIILAMIPFIIVTAFFEKLGNILTILFSYLVMSPFAMFYSYRIYNSLKGIKSSSPASDEDLVKIRKKLIIFAAIGIIPTVLIAAVVIAFYGLAAAGLIPSFFSVFKQ